MKRRTPGPIILRQADLTAQASQHSLAGDREETHSNVYISTSLLDLR